jgi:hypothetical protein
LQPWRSLQRAALTHSLAATLLAAGQVVAAARSWCATANCWVVQGNHDGAALAAARHLAEGGSAADLDPKFDWVDQLLPEVRLYLCLRCCQKHGKRTLLGQGVPEHSLKHIV